MFDYPCTLCRYAVTFNRFKYIRPTHRTTTIELAGLNIHRIASPLPSGYSISDYDASCISCKGYIRWGGSQTSVQSSIDPFHSLKCVSAITNNAKAASILNVLSALSVNSISDISSDEWTSLLLALSQRCLDTQSFIDEVSVVDEKDTEDFEDSMKRVKAGTFPSLADISKQIPLGATLEIYDDSLTSRKRKNDDYSSEDESEEDDEEDEDGDSDIIDSDLEEEAAAITNKLLKRDEDLYEELFGDSDDSDAENKVKSAPQPVVGLDQSSEHLWLSKIFSRRRGIEDALLTVSLVRNVNGSIDASENIFDTGTHDGYEGMDTDEPVQQKSEALQAIIKNCLPRPSESIDMKEWTPAWITKMEELQGDPDVVKDSDSPTRVKCALCGYFEEDLGSQFVWARNWHEWRSCAMEELSRKENEKLSTAFGYKQIKSTDESFLQKNKKKSFHVWLPHNKLDNTVTLIEEELSKMKPSLVDKYILEKGLRMVDDTLILPHENPNVIRHILLPPDNIQLEIYKGSIVAHECCAEFLMSRSSSTLEWPIIDEPRREADILSALANGKIMSLGTDMLGNEYWTLPGSPKLYRCVQSTAISSDQLCDPSIGSAEMGKLEWQIISDENVISTIIASLHRDIPSEKVLQNVLMVLFPYAARQVYTIASLKTSQNGLFDEVVLNKIRSVCDITCTSSFSDLTKMKYTVTHSGTTDMDIDRDNGIKSENIDSHAAVVDSALKKNNSSTMDTEDDDVIEDTDEDEAEEVEDEEEDVQVMVAVKKKHVGRPKKVNRLTTGIKVLVEDEFSCTLWDATIVDVLFNSPTDSSEVQYRVRYQGWDEHYDSWVPATRVHINSTAQDESIKASTQFRNNMRSNLHNLPSVLQSLIAFRYVQMPHREFSKSGPNKEFIPSYLMSSCVNGGQMDDLMLCKCAMLLVYAAIPMGAIDTSEERWGECKVGNITSFTIPSGRVSRHQVFRFDDMWRVSVMQATCATELLECELFLEYGIRTSWLKSGGAKLMTCMAARVFTLRQATVSGICLRLWCLDQAIRYDKVTKGNDDGLDTEDVYIAARGTEDEGDNYKISSKKSDIKKNSSSKSKKRK
jgi:hypothetical protein